MSYLRIEHLAKAYGATRVLHDINLDVAQGEFIVLVGPSGCGKSTLLRAIAGLEEASAGDLYLGDQRVNDVAPRDRDVAMVFQNYALYPHLTVRQNLGFALSMRGVEPGVIEERAHEVARMLSLDALLDRLPKQLSGGQRQRVAMGRAIMRKPKLFLFDEPLSNLDAKLRVQMRIEISALHRRIGATSIFVTHDQVEAMTMADRIVLMQDGLVQQVGTPHELYHRPANLFVASFIGSPAMNLIPATRTAEGLRLADSGEWLAMPHFDSHEAGSVTFGIRPEAIALSSPDPGHWKGEVIAVEDLGYQSFVHCKALGQVICALTSDTWPPRIGSIVGLRPDLMQAHVFDRVGMACKAPEGPVTGNSPSTLRFAKGR